MALVILRQAELDLHYLQRQAKSSQFLNSLTSTYYSSFQPSLLWSHFAAENNSDRQAKIYLAEFARHQADSTVRSPFLFLRLLLDQSFMTYSDASSRVDGNSYITEK